MHEENKQQSILSSEQEIAEQNVHTVEQVSQESVEPLPPQERSEDAEEKLKLYMPQENEKSVAKEILSWIFTLGIAVVAALVIRTYIFEPIRVDGSSMCDTLQDGEVMIATKFDYLMDEPQFGDVVICKYPGRKENFVKRLMGLPGDEIAVLNNVVFRNGVALKEPYLTSTRNRNGFTMLPFRLGDGEYFVMGDNRDNSHDSRNYYSWSQPAALTRDMIKGHVRCVVFPFNTIRGIE